MEEMVLRWIERVGFPIFAACATSSVLGWIVYKLFMRYDAMMTDRVASMDAHAEKLANFATASNNALGMNTLATKELTDTIKKKLGSDPDGICQAQAALHRAGIECKAEEVILVLKKLEEKRARHKPEHKDE